VKKSCNENPRSFPANNPKRKIIYQISFNIDENGTHHFDIMFPRNINNEQNAMIIAELMLKISTELEEHFNGLVKMTNNKKTKNVITMAFNMWRQLMNKEFYNGVVKPPTQVFG